MAAKKTVKANTAYNTLIADIKAFGKESRGIRQKAQDIMYRCVFVYLDSGNATPATLLVKEMGEAWHLRAVKVWFEHFGGMRWAKNENGEERFEKNKEAFDAMKAEYSKSKVAFGSKLKKQPVFWEYTPNPEYKGFDLVAFLKSGLTRTDKLAKDKEKLATGKVKNLHFRDRLAALVKELEAEIGDEDDEGGSSPVVETSHTEEAVIH
jgi:hypothetical protein